MTARHDPGAATVEAPYDEVSSDCASSVYSTTRYYRAFGRIIATRTTTSSASDVRYYVADHLGSTTALLTASGSVYVGGMKYWPFGGLRSGGLAQTDRQFTGQRSEAADPGLGVYNYGARFYSSSLGRFLSADPVQGALGLPQRWNPYSNVMNNPLRYTDPTGACLPGIDNKGPCHGEAGDDDSSFTAAPTVPCDVGCQFLTWCSANPGDCAGAIAYAAAVAQLDPVTGCVKGNSSCREERIVPGTDCPRWDHACIERARSSDVCALSSDNCPLSKFETNTRPCSPVFGDVCGQGDAPGLIDLIGAAKDFLSDPDCLGFVASVVGTAGDAATYVPIPPVSAAGAVVSGGSKLVAVGASGYTRDGIGTGLTLAGAVSIGGPQVFATDTTATLYSANACFR